MLAMSGSQPLDTGYGHRQVDAGGDRRRWTIRTRDDAGTPAGRHRQGQGREGRYKGRAPTARRQASEIIRLKAEGVRPTEIAKRLSVGRASVYRVLGEQAGEDQQEAA